MGKTRQVSEEWVRSAKYVHHDTLRLSGGEVDIFHSEGHPDPMIEIRVTLVPCKGIRNQIAYESIALLNRDGTNAALRVNGEDGRALDREMTEVLAWEMIEYHPLGVGYVEGREPGRVRGPEPVPEPVRDMEPDGFC
ncbi:hypothetical protein LAZ40_07080 [Cereibacter sphaeroides]|uniref:hypothetical protein n=1 Tax=Cereibacter sphaeroides TaxID=1063 RepID=UPI001F273CC1|nr:hypothetical protein [Cereibacter sphaeroides]MCE6958811.1 hypothetical protein [Cereibacter sphaeroides]MCE6973315.1 hypothetical protein [Cereibacter sphaeroides]